MMQHIKLLVVKTMYNYNTLIQTTNQNIDDFIFAVYEVKGIPLLFLAKVGKMRIKE